MDNKTLLIIQSQISPKNKNVPENSVGKSDNPILLLACHISEHKFNKSLPLSLADLKKIVDPPNY